MNSKEMLQQFKKIAVVGLSSDPGRASYGVSRYMQKSGYQITPVNPNEVEVLGEKAYASLDEVPGPIEIVDIFRRPEFVPDIVDAAIRRQAKVIGFTFPEIFFHSTIYPTHSFDTTIHCLHRRHIIAGQLN